MEPQPSQQETRGGRILRGLRNRLFIIGAIIGSSMALVAACEPPPDYIPSGGGVSSQASQEMEEARKRATQPVPALHSPTPTFIPAPKLGTPESSNPERRKFIVGNSSYTQR